MILLDGVQETMLIPLAIKASETQRVNARIHDMKAVEIVKKLGLDVTKYDKFMSHEGVVARTILFDEAMQKYLNQYPEAVCISVGCGFDSRFSRVDNGKILWYDLDFPEVIKARGQFFSEQERVHVIPKSALDPTWTNEVEKRKKTIILIEGMLMYLTEKEVVQLFKILSENFKDAIVLAELMPPSSVKGGKYHDTVKNTNATFKWGIKSGKELENLCQGLALIDEKSFNCEMKKYSLRGKLFASIPGIRDCNDRIAIYSLKNDKKEDKSA